MLLYFVRHGDPVYNPDSLTPLGLRQAEAVGRRLARYGLDQIFSSPMIRAQETARPAAEMLRKKISTVEFASEDRAWQGLSALDDQGRRRWACDDPETRALFTTPEVRALGMDWYDHPAFVGNTYKDYMHWMGGECDAFFAALGYERQEWHGFYRAVRLNGERIGLFAHGGFGGAFLSHVLGIPYPQLSRMINLSHSSLTVIEFADRERICIPVLLTLSNDAHLYHENLPLYDRAKF